MKFYTVEDIQEMLDVGKSTAYRMIHEWNVELREKGYFVLKGRVPQAFVDERLYGRVDK